MSRPRKSTYKKFKGRTAVWVMHAYHYIIAEYGLIEELGLYAAMVEYTTYQKRLDYGLDERHLIVSSTPSGPWKYWHYADDLTDKLGEFPIYHKDPDKWCDVVLTSEREWRDKILKDRWEKVTTNLEFDKDPNEKVDKEV